MTRPSFARAALGTVLCVLGLHWVSSCRSELPARTAANAAASSSEAGALGDSHPGPCDDAPEPMDCFLQRAWLIEELLGDLYELELSRDQRAVAPALEALDTGEKDVQIAALRVLGQFPSAPGVGAKVLPWLLADDVERQGAAAKVLAETGDPGYVRLAQQFAMGHDGKNGAPPWPWWRDPTRHGHKAYPNAQRFPPGDSLRSVGLVTSDPVASVIQFYTEKNSPKPFDFDAYQARRMAASERVSQKLQQAAESPALLEMQKKVEALMKEYERTKDPKIIEKLSQLKPVPLPDVSQLEEDDALSLPLPGGPEVGQSRFLVIEERDGVAVRAVVAYPEPALGKNVILLGFNPTLSTGPKGWSLK